MHMSKMAMDLPEFRELTLSDGTAEKTLQIRDYYELRTSLWIFPSIPPFQGSTSRADLGWGRRWVGGGGGGRKRTPM